MVASHIPPRLKRDLESIARDRKMSTSSLVHELIEIFVNATIGGANHGKE